MHLECPVDLASSFTKTCLYHVIMISLGSGPRYQILSHVSARCYSLNVQKKVTQIIYLVTLGHCLDIPSHFGVSKVIIKYEALTLAEVHFWGKQIN